LSKGDALWADKFLQETAQEEKNLLQNIGQRIVTERSIPTPNGIQFRRVIKVSAASSRGPVIIGMSYNLSRQQELRVRQQDWIALQNQQIKELQGQLKDALDLVATNKKLAEQVAELKERLLSVQSERRESFEALQEEMAGLSEGKDMDSEEFACVSSR
jgi:hypothetical protein